MRVKVIFNSRVKEVLEPVNPNTPLYRLQELVNWWKKQYPNETVTYSLDKRAIVILDGKK